jgi:hypothetical protein
VHIDYDIIKWSTPRIKGVENEPSVPRVCWVWIRARINKILQDARILNWVLGRQYWINHAVTKIA